MCLSSGCVNVRRLCRSRWSQLFKSWRTKSTVETTIQWMTQLVSLILIRRIQPLNNRVRHLRFMQNQPDKSQFIIFLFFAIVEDEVLSSTFCVFLPWSQRFLFKLFLLFLRGLLSLSRRKISRKASGTRVVFSIQTLQISTVKFKSAGASFFSQM